MPDDGLRSCDTAAPRNAKSGHVRLQSLQARVSTLIEPITVEGSLARVSVLSGRADVVSYSSTLLDTFRAIIFCSIGGLLLGESRGRRGGDGKRAAILRGLARVAGGKDGQQINQVL